MRFRGVNRRGARDVGSLKPFTSPSMTLSADNAWRARDATIVGGFTTAWPAYRGGVTLAQVGSGQAAPTPNALLGNRLAVPWSVVGSYQGTIVAPGDSQTLAVVCVCSTTNVGLLSLTAAGAANTGSSILYTGNVLGRRLATDASTAKTSPFAAVVITTLTTAGASLYVNSLTPATTATATGTFSQTDLILGALSSANLFVHSGAIAEAAVWSRVLTAGEIADAMTRWCSYYGQVLS